MPHFLHYTESQKKKIKSARALLENSHRSEDIGQMGPIQSGNFLTPSKCVADQDDTRATLPETGN